MGQVLGQARCAILVQPVARRIIAGDRPVKEPREPRCGRRFTDLAMRCHDGRAAVHRAPQIPCGKVVARRKCRRRGDFRHRQTGRNIAVAQVFPKRGIDLVKATRTGLRLPRLMDQMARVAGGGDARRAQGRFDPLVARTAFGIVKPVPMHLLGAGFSHQRHQRAQRIAAPQYKIAADGPQPGREGRNPQPKPPFRCRTKGRETIIMDKHRDDRRALRTGRHQRRVIGEAKIPADPIDDRCGHAGGCSFLVFIPQVSASTAGSSTRAVIFRQIGTRGRICRMGALRATRGA